MSLRLSPEWRARVLCAACRRPLLAAAPEGGEPVECPHCRSRHGAEGGVLRLGRGDAFYEEHGFTSSGRDFKGLLGRAGLYFARQHFLHEIARALPPGCSVVEIGCGGGSRFLAGRYQMLGVELSARSAARAGEVYDSVIQGSAEELPLADGCADGVASSFVLEHLDDGAAPRALSEMARVLKPGGRMLHFFDLDADGPFWSWAKTQPWHRAVFVDEKGHRGLRRWEEWRALFTRAGLEVEAARFSCKSWLQDLSVWSQLDRAGIAGPPRLAGRLARAFARRFDPWATVANLVLNDLIDPWLPRRWSAKVIARLRKPA